MGPDRWSPEKEGTLLKEQKKIWEYHLFTPTEPGENSDSRGTNSCVPKVVALAHAEDAQKTVEKLMNACFMSMPYVGEPILVQALLMAVEEYAKEHPGVMTTVSLFYIFSTYLVTCCFPNGNKKDAMVRYMCQMILNKIKEDLDHVTPDIQKRTLPAILVGDEEDQVDHRELNDILLAGSRDSQELLVNARDVNGETAAHYCVRRNKPEHLRVLVKNGADLRIKVSY